MTDEQIVRAAAPLVIAWDRANRRALPWREEPTPYHVWVSEIMLQQTRVEAVLGYYRRFLDALPDIQSLSEVDEDRLLKLWEGLGYYSRARNLKKAAEELMTNYGGELPRSAAELRKLPGIGDYTAGAIASLAYGEPEPAVDGNVLRVLMRLLACPDDVMDPRTRKRAAELLRGVYPRGEDAALLTEGIMELGETICIPNGEAACLLCPLQGLCRALAAASTQDYPVRSRPKERRIERRTVLLLHCNGRFALHRRPETGLLAGMWEFPNREGELQSEELEALLGVKPLHIQSCGQTKHVFSHVEWRMQGYLVELDREADGFIWQDVQTIEEAYSLPTAFRYYRRKLHEWSDI